MKIDPNIKEDLKKFFQEKIRKSNEKVAIISAYPLNDEEKKVLKSRFPMLEKNENVEYMINPNLIAGIQVKVGSKTYDLSLKGQLSSLKHILYESA